MLAKNKNRTHLHVHREVYYTHIELLLAEIRVVWREKNDTYFHHIQWRLTYYF